MRHIPVVVLLVVFVGSAYGAGVGVDGSRSGAGNYPSILGSREDYPFVEWQHGGLVAHGMISGAPGPKIAAAIRNGKVLAQGSVWMPDIEALSITGAAVSPEGKVRIAGGIGSTDGKRANFVAALGSGTTVAEMIRTNPYVPIFLCTNDENHVWTFGRERDEKDERHESKNYFMLREYDLKKGLVLSLLNRNTMGVSFYPSRGRYVGDVGLFCGAHAIGLYSGPTNEWIEYDLAQQKLKRTPLLDLPDNVKVTGVAMTDSGRVFASLFNNSADHALTGIFELVMNDKGIGHWEALKQSVSSPVGRGDVFTPTVIGSDGTDVAYLDRAASADEVFWFTPPEMRSVNAQGKP